MHNPVLQDWYADPEARVYSDTVYLYVTRSLPYGEQVNLDVVMTRDLKHYEVARDILDMSTFPGAYFAVWAPTVVEQAGRYYIAFAANCLKHDHDPGGIYVGVSDQPEGPFCNVFADGRPLLNVFYNGAQPIDAHFFKDDDGQIYLYYGGCRHLIVCRMKETMDGFLPMEAPCIQGVAREITPPDYVEAPCVVKTGERYQLMYSSGSWTDGTYCVKAAEGKEPCGTFRQYDEILSASELADEPGHNSAFCLHGVWYTAYHRRTVGDSVRDHRQLCIDRLEICNGRLQKVTMT